MDDDRRSLAVVDRVDGRQPPFTADEIRKLAGGRKLLGLARLGNLPQDTEGWVGGMDLLQGGHQLVVFFSRVKEDGSEVDVPANNIVIV